MHHRSTLLATLTASFFLRCCLGQVTLERLEDSASCTNPAGTSAALGREDLDGTLAGVVSLSLAGCSIAEIQARTFEDLADALVTLDLSGNGLTELASEALAPLASLVTLDASRNSIGTLADDAFAPAAALTALDLSRNRLAALPTGLFDRNAALESLDLSMNALAAIPPDAFSPLTSLKFVNLSGNVIVDLTPLANMPALISLDVSRNRIASIPVFSMPLLQHLDISTNLLTTLGLAPGTHLPRGLKTVKLHRNPWQCACLDQVLAVLVRRRVSFQATPFFQGRAPVCVVPDAKANRCAGASTASKAQLEKTYQTALKKYPQTINRI